MQRGGIRTTVRAFDDDADVLGTGLRIGELDVEVTVVVEHARLEQLVLGLVDAAAAPTTASAPYRRGPHRVVAAPRRHARPHSVSRPRFECWVETGAIAPVSPRSSRSNVRRRGRSRLRRRGSRAPERGPRWWRAR